MQSKLISVVFWIGVNVIGLPVYHEIRGTRTKRTKDRFFARQEGNESPAKQFLVHNAFKKK
jgi:hypothetical protein